MSSLEDECLEGCIFQGCRMCTWIHVPGDIERRRHAWLIDIVEAVSALEFLGRSLGWLRRSAAWSQMLIVQARWSTVFSGHCRMNYSACQVSAEHLRDNAKFLSTRWLLCLWNFACATPQRAESHQTMIHGALLSGLAATCCC